MGICKPFLTHKSSLSLSCLAYLEWKREIAMKMHERKMYTGIQKNSDFSFLHFFRSFERRKRSISDGFTVLKMLL